MSEEMVNVPIVGRIEDDGRIVYDKNPDFKESENLETTEWYEAIVDDCKAIVTESIWNSQVELMTGYGEVGKRICEDENYSKFGKGNGEFVKKLFKDIGISSATGYKCLQFYEKIISKVEDADVSRALETMPEGKSLSWTKICNKYLPEENGKTVQEDCKHEKFMCVHCRKTFTKEEIKNDKIF